jgi:hypothetical protein
VRILCLAALKRSIRRRRLEDYLRALAAEADRYQERELGTSILQLLKEWKEKHGRPSVEGRVDR